MDDFVSKPLDPDDFLRVVRRFVADAGERDAAGGSRAAPASVPDLDDAQLDALTRLMPAKRLRKIIESFLAAAQARLQQIEACARQGDLAAMAREAHDLKAVSGNFGARRLQHLAERLEQAAKAHDAGEVASLTAEVRRASITAWDLVARRLALLKDADRELA
jgi:HPt (histidine-containing phosphotransfer) domain-containing protein